MTQMDDISALDAKTTASLIREKRLSAVEVMTSTLRNIDRLHDDLCAFINVFHEEAMREAQLADEAIAAGRDVGPLHGLPFGVKDLIDVRTKATTANSRCDPHIARRDATIVRNLRRSGAILVGKLALEEFGIGSPADPLPWPPARNPWDLNRTPGGSSSGCGVALASRQLKLAVGTDTAGSIRNPAAMCGVVGLKPSKGMLSLDGIFPLSPTLDHVGPMSRTVSDNELLLRAMAGDITSRSTTLSEIVEDHHSPLRGHRIGVLKQFYTRDVQVNDDTHQVIARVLEEFSSLGAVLNETQTSSLKTFVDCTQVILRTEAYAIHANKLRNNAHMYGERCRIELMSGQEITEAQYTEAQQLRRRLTLEMEQALIGHDILVTAVAPEPACRLDDPAALERSANGMLRAPFNLTGHPSMSICAGFSVTGLPIGFQLIARRGDESRLYQIAKHYEAATQWHLAAPALESRCEHFQA